MTRSNNTLPCIEQNVDLIDGVFTPDKAQEIVNQLVSNEINSLKLQSFSQQVRYGSTDDVALAKTDTLTKERRRVEELIHLANQTGKSVSIQSKIILTIS